MSNPSNPSSPSPYRNEIDALQERRSTLQTEIAKLREQTTTLEDLRAREVALAGELAGVEGRLAAGAAPTKRALPLLDQVRVASPCNAEWSEMLGDERVRYCLSCEKNVFNLSSMTRDAAETLLRDRVGDDMCVRFYQRADGTILTADCPTGVKKKRRKKLALAVAGAGALAAAAATAMFRQQACAPTMGAMGDLPPVAQEQRPVPPVAPITPITTEPVTDGPGPAVQPQRWVAGGLRIAPAPTPSSPKVIKGTREIKGDIKMGLK